MIDPSNPKHKDTPSEKNKFQVMVKEYRDTSGASLFYEQYETIISISSFDHAKKYKIACESCNKFGKNLSCPPYSPYFPEYLDTQNYAKVLCIRMPQEYFRDVIQEKICSLESLGVNLIALTKHCFEFDLEWSANDHATDFVCSIGAIFLDENKMIG